MKPYHDVTQGRILELAALAGLIHKEPDIHPTTPKSSSDNDCFRFSQALYNELAGGKDIEDMMLERIEEISIQHGGFQPYLVSPSDPGATCNPLEILKSATKAVSFTRFAYSLSAEFKLNQN